MPIKKTNEQFIEELKNKNPSISALEEYIRGDIKIKFVCKKCSYKWNTKPSSVLLGSGCPRCSGHVKETTEQFTERIKKENPNIEIIGEYLGSTKRIKVKCCNCGHIWNPYAHSISYQGSKCQKCRGNYRFSHDEFLERINSVNPTIIIKEKYTNANSRIQCECMICGYSWNPYAGSLLSGTGCPNCSNVLKKNTDTFIKELTEINPNIIVIGEYKTAHTKISVKCTICNTEWESKPNNLLNGQGCPKCADIERRKKTTKQHEQFIRDLKTINNNIIVVGQYVNAKTKIECNCKLCNHKWNSTPNDLLSGNGCPNCCKNGTSFIEKSILLAFQLRLGVDKVFSRDKSLIGKELDIYIPSLNLAIEPGSWYWHKDKIKNDIEKHKLCDSKNVQLFIIYDSCKSIITNDYVWKMYSEDLSLLKNRSKLSALIDTLFEKYGIPQLSETEYDSIFDSAYIKSRRITTQEFIKLAEKKNNKVIVLGNYTGYKNKIKCSCKNCGYEWGITPNHILSGKGCPYCFGKPLLSDEEFKKKLLSVNDTIIPLQEYKNSKTNILVKCTNCNNIWSSKPSNLLYGYGCPSCSKNTMMKKLHSKNVDLFFENFKIKGNKAVKIIGNYINAKTKILCECKMCKNQWYVTPNSLLQGHGCPVCAKNKN